MTYYICNGNTFHVTSDDSIDIRKELPAATFLVKFNPKAQSFYLETTQNFTRLPKYYGDAEAKAARVANTISKRDRSLGVMLAGEKGSGKTMLAMLLSANARDRGIPTLIVNTGYYNNNDGPNPSSVGDEFCKFIKDIDQECVIIFDEFEKTYKNEDQQNSILTLLDGIFSSKKLFIITCNDASKVSSHIRNRPGRLHYYFSYTGLSEDFVVEYCNDKLDNKDNIGGIVKIANVFHAFNFDMLQALVLEMNMYNETASVAMSHLNIKIENEYSMYGESSTIVELLDIDGIPVDPSEYSNVIYGNLLTSGNFYVTVEDDEDRIKLGFKSADVIELGKDGTFKFQNEDGYVLTTKANRYGSSSFVDLSKLL